MPLYDFECVGCRNTFEKEHPRNVPNPPCPLCTGKTEKRISPPPVIFKGGGFYKTDSTAKPKKPASVSEKAQNEQSRKNEPLLPKISEKTGTPKPPTKE